MLGLGLMLGDSGENQGFAGDSMLLGEGTLKPIDRESKP